MSRRTQSHNLWFCRSSFRRNLLFWCYILTHCPYCPWGECSRALDLDEWPPSHAGWWLLEPAAWRCLIYGWCIVRLRNSKCTTAGRNCTAPSGDSPGCLGFFSSNTEWGTPCSWLSILSTVICASSAGSARESWGRAVSALVRSFCREFWWQEVLRWEIYYNWKIKW